MQRYLDIINHFGVRNQMKKLNEETFEFLEAVDLYEDAIANDTFYSKEELYRIRDHVVEELGDVLLLLTQYVALYCIEKDELDKHMDYKLERTEGYINDILGKRNSCEWERITFSNKRIKRRR